MTDPTQDPSQTRRKKAASGPSPEGVPVAPARRSAYVADPTHGSGRTGAQSDPTHSEGIKNETLFGRRIEVKG